MPLPKYLLLMVSLSLMACGVSESSDISAPQGQNSSTHAERSNLDQAAIDAGVLADPATFDLTGLYERQSGLGVDRFCAVPKQGRNYDYDIGILIVFGRDSQCEGQGEAQLRGEQLEIRLNDGPDVGECMIAAVFDGSAINVSGHMPPACRKFCSARASMAGASMLLTQKGRDAAESALGREIEYLCRAK